MKSFIGKAILICLGLSVCLSLLFVFAVKFATSRPVSPDENHRNLNCFSGLEFAIPIGIQLFLAIVGLSAFLNVFEKIRSQPFLSFCTFFLIQIVLFFLSIKEMIGQNDVWIIILYFLFYMLPWTYFYIKFRKKWGFKSSVL